MSEFAGVVRFDGRVPDLSEATPLLAGLEGAYVAAPTVQCCGAALLGFCQSLYVPEDACATQPITLGDGAVLASDARLDELPQAAAALRRSPADATHPIPAQISDVHCIAAAWRQWGPEAVAHLYGDFAFAVWEPRRGRLTLSRDALGVRTLYYYRNARYVAFATRIRALLQLPALSRALDDLALADFLTQSPMDLQTIYRSIRRVPGGGSVIFERGHETVRRYWTRAHLQPVIHSRDDDYVEAAREHLDAAVRNRLRRVGGIASMLSGGFDSTGVTSTAAQLLKTEPLPALTRVPGAAHPYRHALDEHALAATVAARYANIDWHVVDEPTSATSCDDTDRESLEAGMPQRTAFNAAWFRPLRQRARDGGARILLCGVLGNSSLSWNGNAAYADYLRTGRWLKLAHEINQTARIQQRPRLSVVRQRLMPAIRSSAAARLIADRRRREVWLGSSMIAPGFIDDIGYAAHFRQRQSDFAGQPMFRERFPNLCMEYMRDMDGILRNRDGLEKRDPFSDRRLMEFLLGTPGDQFLRNGQTRWLARRSLADRVPAAVLSQQRVALQVPEWYAIASQRMSAMRQILSRIPRSPLAMRVLDQPRMRVLLDSWPSDTEAARDHMAIHGHALARGMAMAEFLCSMDGV